MNHARDTRWQKLTDILGIQREKEGLLGGGSSTAAGNDDGAQKDACPGSGIWVRLLKWVSDTWMGASGPF